MLNMEPTLVLIWHLVQVALQMMTDISSSNGRVDDRPIYVEHHNYALMGRPGSPIIRTYFSPNDGII